DRFVKECTAVRENGGRLVALAGQRDPAGEVRLAYTFEVEGRLTRLEVCTVKSAVPSLFSTFPNADFPERQAASLYSIKFLGHPNLNLEVEAS
ncbi:MAG: NADH-quinone oxidoreductase subunit C, partial [Candidatus Eremiobacterota bacterium]